MFQDSPLRTRFALRRMSLRPGLSPEQRGVIAAALGTDGDTLTQVGQTLDDAAGTANVSLGTEVGASGAFLAAIEKLLANLPQVIELIETLLQELGVLPAPTPSPATATAT